MAQTYTVNYNIKVNSTSATSAINSFVQATQKLNKSVADINKLQTALNKLGKTAYTMKFNVGNANRSLDSVLRRLREIDRLAKRNRTITINQGAGRGRGSRGGAGTTTPAVAPVPTGTSAPKPQGSRSVYKGGMRSRGGNYAYKALGPSMIDSGGVGAIDMLKGMGIMYGITGLGTMMSDIIKQSSEYNNLIQSTRNILSVHDNRDNFNGRFAGMEETIRRVGMETKYTAPEVADASKFLAMAGLQVEDINNSIRPIADIALIGDTDLGTTADYVTNIMTGFEIPAERMRDAADVMTSTFTSSNTTLIDLAEAYKYAGAILTNAGVDFETASGALGILGNAGRKGSLGGTDMRMMLQNIMNPTKKQKAMWEQVGVERYDASGNLRPLNEIFGDLAAKGTTAQQIMAMFRTTTAPSAMNLMRHVDDWNTIIERNRNASGLSERLADEKKNTIQGLWAQLTSIFTEDGLQAFEGLQEQIRGFLREIIEQLKKPEAVNMLKKFGFALLDLIDTIKEFTRIWLGLYDRFGGVIQLWLKFQLVVSAILIPLRIFRSLINFGAFIGSSVRAIGAMVVQFSQLRSALRSVTAMNGRMKSFWASMTPGGATNVGYIPADGVKNFTSAIGKTHQNVDAATLRRYQSYTQQVQATQAKVTIGAGMGGMVGAGLGAWGGSYIGEPGSTANTFGILGGSAGGMLLGSYLGSQIPGWVSALFAAAVANPITAGIACIGGAVLSGIHAWYRYNNAIEEGKNRAAEWVKQMHDLNIEGMDVTKKFGLMMAYARIDASGESEEKKNELRQKAWGRFYDSEKSDEKIDNSQAFQNITGGEKLKEYLLIADQTWGKADTFMPMLEEIGMRAYSRIQFGEEYKDYWLNGASVFPLQNKDGMTRMNKEEALRAALILAGYDNNSPLMNKISDVAFNDIYSISRSQDIRSTWDRIRSQYFPQNSYTYSDKSVSDFQNMPYSELVQSYYYQIGLDMSYKELQDQFAQWQALITQYDAGTQITADQTQAVLHTVLGRFFDPNFGLFGTAQFNQHIQQLLANPTQYGYGSTKEATDAITNTFTDLLAFFNLLDTRYKPLFAQYLNRNIWEGILPSNVKLPAGGIVPGFDGQTTIINGKRYTWGTPKGPFSPNYKTWVDDNGQIYVPSDASKTTTPNNGVNALGNHQNNHTGGGKRGGKGNRSTGVDSSQYKNHYMSQNAAPKQVIVRIGNLMNVDKIDLSNKDNSLAVESVKSQLSQALIDVVHDFDESWNGNA